MSRKKLLELAAQQNGIKESPAGSNKTKYGEWYGLNGEKWCAIFVSWVYHHAGYPLGYIDRPNGYQSCASAYNFWKRNLQLTASPQPGDIVLFDWNGDGWCDHTGIFIEWVKQGETFLAWEGNTAMGNDSDGGQVMRRERKKASVKAFVNPGVIDKSYKPVAEILKKGDLGSSVTALQKKLYDLGYKITVDGDFGKETEKFVKQFQQDKGLEQTGEVNIMLHGLIDEELSKPKIKESKLITGSFLKKGDVGAAVIELQNAINKKGANPKITIDGVFGNQTLKALKTFQQNKGLKADGIAGPQTFKALGIAKI
jgi:peptidoglycan hydrolase-like protein with peptidoglycan-binding domain